jgi:carbonic anhydrase/acetyltransferase-like protein (isoleucine patch superfamily)
MAVRSYQGHSPVLGPGVYVDETALVVGRVHIGDDSSLWPMSVVRGDVNFIEIGARTNIQDGCVLHVTHDSPYDPGGHPVRVGNGVTVGHRVVLHACTIGDDCLIGMGSIIMDGAVLHPRVIVGAGSLVAPGKELEGGFLFLGSPAKKVRALTQKELAFLEYSAAHYIALKNKHLAG